MKQQTVSVEEYQQLVRESWDEETFQKAVIDVAHECGWHAAHFRKSRTKHGWSTAVQADGKGFPDLVLVRERVIWPELKVGKNKLSKDQENWRDWLLAAGQEWYCWYPRDWETIKKTLL